MSLRFVRVVILRRLRWAGHAVQLGETRYTEPLILLLMLLLLFMGIRKAHKQSWESHSFTFSKHSHPSVSEDHKVCHLNEAKGGNMQPMNTFRDI